MIVGTTARNVVGRAAKYFPHNADLCFYLIHLQYTRFPAKPSTYLARDSVGVNSPSLINYLHQRSASRQ